MSSNCRVADNGPHPISLPVWERGPYKENDNISIQPKPIQLTQSTQSLTEYVYSRPSKVYCVPCKQCFMSCCEEIILDRHCGPVVGICGMCALAAGSIALCIIYN